MQRRQVGSGLMGEQGAESIHAHIMTLEKRYNNIPNEVEKLSYIFKECGGETSAVSTEESPSGKPS